MAKQTERLFEENLSNEGYLMKIVQYNHCKDIVVEFQDEYKARVHTSYRWFTLGTIKNPYHPSVYGVGIVGNKYQTFINKKQTKEYLSWRRVLGRCFDENFKEQNQTYQNAICCKEWLYFENFYDWLHSQENFDKWLNGSQWAIDKDILIKGNKIYSPETCCLVPKNVNGLFVKCDALRNSLPIGVVKHGSGYLVSCKNPFTSKHEYFGTHPTEEIAFNKYKKVKENFIKQVAEEELANGNIIKECYEAMMKYQVEITD